MRPATPLIRRCPNCHAPFREQNYASFNTFGLERYTDGKASGPHLPDFHNLKICPECAAPVWRDEAVKLGEFRGFWDSSFIVSWLRKQSSDEPLEHCHPASDEKAKVQQSSHSDTQAERYHPDPEWEDTKYCKDPGVKDYLLALQQGKGNTREREIKLRIRLWWFANDRHRWRRVPIGGNEPELQLDERVNVYTLFGLLKDTDERERILKKAEAARELGQFELAVNLLSTPFNDQNLEADALVIANLARQKKTKVELFPFVAQCHG